MNISSHYKPLHFIPWVPAALLGTATAFISGFINSSRNIELDLREMLREKDLHPAIQLQNNIIL